MEKIESNDHLLSAILVRLPPKSLFRFKCVSKRWNNIMTNRFFIQSYEARKREERLSSKGLLAFIKQRAHVTFRENWYVDNFSQDLDDDDCFSYETIMKITPLSNNDTTIKVVPKRFGYFVHSSNGLILCRQQYHHDVYYYILNPIARKWVSLPPPPRVQEKTTLVGLTCKEDSTVDLAPNYKVVQACIPPVMKVHMSIQTYSSWTLTWTKSTLVGTSQFKIDHFVPLLVFNGVFHWFLLYVGLAIAIYDSKGGHGNRVQVIVLPYDDEMIIASATVTRSLSDDVLWFGVEIKNKCSQFWMLPKDQDKGYWRSTTIPEKEWTLMHAINHDSLRKELVCFIPGNPLVAILRILNRIYLYNLETKSMDSALPIDGHIAALKEIFYYCDIYMEPLSLSSYALSANTY